MTATIDSRELPDLDQPPPYSANTAPQQNDGDRAPWSCEVCGNPVPPTPSGRKPRLMRCDEHRSAKGPTANAPRAAGGSGQHARIQEGLTGLHGMIAFSVGMISLPTGDMVWAKDRDIITEYAPKVSEAWATYCDTNPKMRKAMLSLLDTAGMVSIAGAYAPMVWAITMNHKSAAEPAPVPVQHVPQAPPNPFQRPRAAQPTVIRTPQNPPPGPIPETPIQSRSPFLGPPGNGNGLPFATDVPG
jgi:hypothetical protein